MTDPIVILSWLLRVMFGGLAVFTIFVVFKVVFTLLPDAIDEWRIRG